MYQNIYNPMPQPQSNNVEWISVNGIQGAKDVQVMRGQTAWLMDMNEPIFYVKESNSMGVCSLKAFRFEEIKPEQANPQYATAADIQRLEQMIMQMGGKQNESIVTESTESNGIDSTV